MGNNYNKQSFKTPTGTLVEAQVRLGAGGGDIPLHLGKYVITDLQVSGTSTDRVTLQVGTHVFRAVYTEGAWKFCERIPVLILQEEPVIHVGLKSDQGELVMYRYRQCVPDFSSLRTQKSIRGDSLLYIGNGDNRAPV